MPDVIVEDPITNSLFRGPERHFVFGEEGITSEVSAGRRHAYFTCAEEPNKQLQRALRAEIDEGAWQSLYSTVSRPFDPPTTGRIAVKVINHYGDEVLRVFGV